MNCSLKRNINNHVIARPEGPWQSRMAALKRKRRKRDVVAGKYYVSHHEKSRKIRGIATPACALARNDVRFVWGGANLQTTI